MLLVIVLPGRLYAEEYGNRYNVVIVLDASTSIGYRDPEGLRYDAVKFFTGLLAEKGNNVGTVAFSGAVKDNKPILVGSRKDKESVVTALEKVKLSGETNIGLAIERAVDFLEQLEVNGLESVILLLSDGNTEMNTPQATAKSEWKRDAAVAAAHAAGIRIYSMCLNVDGLANKGVEELREKVSFLDGDYFTEVKNKNDLRDAFNDFYERIYGTSTIRYEGKCGADGKFTKSFVIPLLGVEEVNVIVYDKDTEISLYSPDGSKFDCGDPMTGKTFKIYKISDATSGKWRIEAQGKSNSSVQINMVYNSDVNLEFSVDNENENHGLNPSENALLRAKLLSNGVYASGDEYSAYEAELSAFNARGQRIGSPMKMNRTANGFVTDMHFDREGSYTFSVDVKGSTEGFDDENTEKFFEKTYGTFGPLNVSADQNNTAPSVSEKIIKCKAYKIPFKKAESVQLNLSDFISDAQDDASKIRFDIGESTFNDGAATLSGSVVTFSEDSSSGRLMLTATDSGNLSCSVPVVFRKYDVGLMTVISFAVIALIVAAILGIMLYIALNKRFSGTLTVESYVDGEYREDSVTKPRGKCYLSKFRIDNIGLNNSKSYFQATGKDFVWFCPNKKVMCYGRESKKVKVHSDSGVRISLKGKEDAYLELKYARNPNVRTKH